ncbi:alpha/beta hydrolase [Frankia sp. Mgl5]|uniref:alpha/beta hydrolase n=1 Tax=Frankia sp. Mgl5 TaxID=2933793 RepID=UPI002010A426|nr:alpha/beta hydrolase fold domain-containing protein [Frankia sp. Mgl5]MCK9931339.1 alpha/beta hydrolase [Frankia sp. Mgl5]
MSAPDFPAPPTDPDCGAAWRDIVDRYFGGVSPMTLTEETLPQTRAFTVPGRDDLLNLFPVTEHEHTIAGPETPIVLSVFTLHDHTAAGPGILWIHGGGMATGDRFSAMPALRLAVTTGATVVSVEYRLAPEHPDPAPLDDCYTALLWVAEHAQTLGIDPHALILAGSSAGGGLAAGTALRARDHGGPDLAGLLLLCPMLDDRMHTPSSRMTADLSWTRSSNQTGWRMLLGDRVGTDNVTTYAAPGRATDLSRLPPTFIDVGSVDLFRDEDVAFASTIWACGGDAELHVWPGGVHGFEEFAPHTALATDTLTARSRWLTRILARARP